MHLIIHLYRLFIFDVCKDKKNLSNDIQCKPYFLQKYVKCLKKCQILCIFLSLAIVIVHFTTLSREKMVWRKKNRKKQLGCFFRLYILLYPFSQFNGISSCIPNISNMYYIIDGIIMINNLEY